MPRQDNIEFVADLMQRSQAGALKQSFVLTAIHTYAVQTLAQPTWPPGGFINQESWKLCAQECLDAVELRVLNS